MTKLHDILLNQLKRQDIGLDFDGLNESWKKLLKMVSDTYEDYDEYRYAMERSLDIASDEINKVNTKYQYEINKIHSMNKDSIISVDTQWRIQSLNNQAISTFYKEMSQLVNTPLTDHFVFYNSQNRIVDFERLSDYFECGANYHCPEGALVSLGPPKREFITQYCIKPIYTDDKLSEYAIIIEDIGPIFIEKLKENARYSKLLLELQLKKESLHEISQIMASNNQKILSIQELLRCNANPELQSLQLFLFHNMLRKDSGAEIFMQHKFYNDDQEKQGFYLNALIPYFTEGLNNFLKNELNTIECPVDVKIKEQLDVFSEFFYDLITELIQFFFTSDITKVSFKPVHFSAGSQPKIVLSVEFSQEDELPDERITYKLDCLKRSPIYRFIEYYIINNEKSNFTIDFRLHFSIQLDGFNHHSSLVKLKALVLEQSKSSILGSLTEYGLTELFRFKATSSSDEAVQLIKDGRLTQDEYHLIITNFDDLSRIHKEVLLEISSYLTPDFLGLIALGRADENGPLKLGVPLVRIEGEFWMQHLQSTLFRYGLSLVSTPDQQNALPKLDCQKQSILLIDFNKDSLFFFTNVLHALGYEVFPYGSEACACKSTHAKADIAMVNLNTLSKQAITILEGLFVELDMPTLICLPSLEENHIQSFLNFGVTEYIVKPFSIYELVTLVNKLTRMRKNE
ncbi:response regulator [Legionella waltersii]|uniref:Sensor histidine kinase n=1 Tax=Legionella waltersii TaxID=66969 RepID=A0A0W1A0Y4_9GAMM|nr:response regulator [Legionella waltersii]KTD74984.1 sensor histidine kinase [Legionella waltersii]SNV08303.1 sensor histidine kinase [Legionella waltersii]